MLGLGFIGTALILTFFGCLVGILSAMFGIGGGVVMVPLIRIFFNKAAAVASATSLFAILPTSLMGIVARRGDKTICYGYGFMLGVGGAICAPVGAYMATHLPGWVAMMTTTILLVFTAFMQFQKAGYLQFIKARRRHKRAQAQAWVQVKAQPQVRPQAQGSAQQGAPASSDGLILEYEQRPSLFEQFKPLNLIRCVPVGMFAGIMSGFVGVGGGFILVPLLNSVMKLSIKQATGTSLIAVGMLAIPGVISHALYGNIDYLLGVFFVLGSIPGAQIGAHMLRGFTNQKLTLAFAFVLIAAGIMLLVKELI